MGRSQLISDDGLEMLRLVTAAPGDIEPQWKSWSDRVDIDVLSNGAYGLLPALYRVVDDAGIDHPWVPRLRGSYRRKWAEYQLGIAAAASAGSTLADDGVDYLDSADHLLGRRSARPEAVTFGRPRITVPWHDAPRAVAALQRSGWSATTPTRSLNPVAARATLTRSSWALSHDQHGTLHIVTAFHPALADRRRESSVWQRAAADPASGPHEVVPGDLVVAALTDQIGVEDASRWALGTVDAIEAFGGRIELLPVLDRSDARFVIPVVAERLRLLAAEGLGRDIDTMIADVDELMVRHALPTTPAGRIRTAAVRRAKAIALLPAATRDVVRRSDGLAGVARQLTRDQSVERR